MLKTVNLPPHLRFGIRGLQGGATKAANLVIFAGDTETVRGRPHTVQIVGPDDFTLDFVDEESIFPVFWKWVRARSKRDATNIVYFHNLNFDLRVLFASYHLPIYDQYNDVSLTISLDGEPDPVAVKMLFGRVNKATIKQGRIVVHLFDSKAFTQASLARSLKMFHIGESKLPMPKGLGKERLYSKEFKDYALQDVFALRKLALRIVEIHEHYGARPCITLPSFSARVFRSTFLGPLELIPCPPEQVIRAAELSYHGGKNGFYLEKPEILEDVFEVDISSAYPYAMRELPPLTSGKYERVRSYDPGRSAIYKIEGRTDDYTYPLIYDSVFKAIPPDTMFEGAWITGYELSRLLGSGSEFKIVDGFAWTPDGGANPFRRFVDHFYEKKQSSNPSDPFYYFYKIALNSLYGKLVGTVEIKSQASAKEVERLRAEGVELPEGFQLNERYDPVLDQYVAILSGWRAGSMYNPFWASQITGHTRAYLYDLEQKVGAIHSATDSVKALTPVDSVPGLGGLKVECFGRAYLFRNKLYLHCSRDGSFCGHTKPPYKYPDGQPIVDDDGQHLCKVALHGFKGQVWELWDARHDLIRRGFYDYDYTHVVGLREGLRRREQPCDFVTRHDRITINA